MQQEWDANLGGDHLGPYATGDSDVEEICTQFMTPVPYAYVSHVLRKESYTPKDLWKDLGAAIIANGRATACAPLLNWIRIVSCYSAPPQVAADPPVR